MIKKNIILSVIVLVMLLFVYCTTDEAIIIGPFGNADKYLSVTSSVDKDKVYSNGDSSIVNIEILDVNNSPAIGLRVDFAAQFGSITEYDLTDSSGIASAVFISDANTGENIITIDTGVRKDTLTIDVVNYQPTYVEMFSEFPTLVADGLSTTTITTVFKDSLGNPMSGVLVHFATDLGTLSSHTEQTNDSGVATTILKSVTGGGLATVTAISFVTISIEVEFKNYVPSYIDIDSEILTLLADGMSETNIIAKVYDSNDNVISRAVFNFSTTAGSLSKTTNVRANQDGEAKVMLTSTGSTVDTTAIVRAVAIADTSIAEDINIKFRGITSNTNIDSAKMSDGGIYKAYIRTNLFETFNGENIGNVVVSFSSQVGIMNPSPVQIDDNGTAFSEFNVEVLPSSQNDIFITCELASTSEVSSESKDFDIPGAEILINTVGNYIMGDGGKKGGALVKATLHESDGNKAIHLTGISWSTTLGTIKEKSRTNTMGQSINSLTIEGITVSDTTNVTITANFGDYVSTNEILTLIPPINSNRLILGFESDTTGKGIIPCDLYNSIAIKEAGVSALFVNGKGDGINGQKIYFSIVPNNLAAICPSANTRINGLSMVMMAYPPQSTGQIIRVWAEAPDGTKGSVDVILP